MPTTQTATDKFLSDRLHNLLAKYGFEVQAVAATSAGYRVVMDAASSQVEAARSALAGISSRTLLDHGVATVAIVGKWDLTKPEAPAPKLQASPIVSDARTPKNSTSDVKQVAVNVRA